MDTEKMREGMLADGWEVADPGPVSQLQKEGWIAMFSSRGVTIWGPDRLQVRTPEEYDWDLLQGELHHCLFCGAKDVETTRMGFAGRCCLDCRRDQKLIDQYEYAGWTS